MFVESRLHCELLGLDPAIFLCIVLVNEFYGKDGVVGMKRRCFLDARESSAVVKLDGWIPRTSLMYHAYAPEPIVLETSLNGTWVGNGASCECGMDAAMVSPPALTLQSHNEKAGSF